MVLNSVLFSFFHMWLYSFPSTTYWRGCICYIVYPDLLCQRWGNHRCVGLFLGFLSCSIDLYVCFCAGTILSWWLHLGSIVGSQEVWFLQLHFFFSLSLKIDLASWGLLYFHTDWKFFSSSGRNTMGYLIGISLNLQITLGSIVYFTLLILPIQEHDISLNLLVSALISSIRVL